MWPKVVNSKGSPTISSKGVLENNKELWSQNGLFFLKCQGIIINILKIQVMEKQYYTDVTKQEY